MRARGILWHSFIIAARGAADRGARAADYALAALTARDGEGRQATASAPC